jgi:serine/threonine protein kinase
MFAAPEQLSSSKDSYGPKVDMYSLGVVLIEMFRKDCPFREIDKIYQELKKGQVEKDVAADLNKWDKNIVEMIERLISKDPNCRPSATELINR